MKKIFENNQTQKIINFLENKSINTWFDIGYFLDGLKKTLPLRPPTATVSNLGELYKKYQHGVAFITFELGLDGVTVEMMKYATSLSNILGSNTSIHWLTGNTDPSLEYFKNPKTYLSINPLLQGFEKSGLIYQSLFHTKLERGDELYNLLPVHIWEKVILLTQDLLNYIEKNKIELILTVNTVSNPGNLPLVIALAIISQLYSIPIISLNHDFYWEGGGKRKKGEKSGPRDHFFKNADIGEIFSLIQILYPWDGPNWIHANINTLQSNTILKNLGFNPFNITEITSAIDTSIFRPYSLKQKELVYKKLNLMFCQDNLKILPNNSTSSLDLDCPVVISNSHHPLNFDKDTLLLLQPTRIISRKKIEKDLLVIEGIFKELKTKNKKDIPTIVLLITGPIAKGSEKYTKNLLIHIQALFRRLAKYDHRVFIALKLGKNSSKSFHLEKLKPIEMNDLYGVSSFTMLPSEQEGRGLPILESAAAGVPLIINCFDPEDVYREVLGLDMVAQKRFKVFELPKKHIGTEFIKNLLDYIQNKQKKNKLIKHNREVIQTRYSTQNLDLDFKLIFEKLFLIQRDHNYHKKVAKYALKYLNQKNKPDKYLIFNKNRTYIPGVMKYRFLSQVKSIIDPCYFRIEEKETLSEIYRYAKSRITPEISEDKKELFFNSIRELFSVNNGKYKTELDTTFDYRYRDNTLYPWRELTEPEFFGAISYIENKILKPINKNETLSDFLSKATSLIKNTEIIKQINNHQAQTLAQDFNVINNNEKFLKNQIVNKLQTPMVICDWNIFAKRILEKPQTLVIFPGKYQDIALDLLVYDYIVKAWDQKKAPYFLNFACNNQKVKEDTSLGDFCKILESGIYPSLYNAYQKKLIKIIPVGSKGSSVNLLNISPELKKALYLTKKKNGHVLAKGEHNYFSLDLLDIPSFRYGTINSIRSQAVFNIPKGGLFFQFIPAGFRSFFSFPLTTETPLQFSKILNNIYDFNNLESTEKLLTKYKEYLDEHGTSLKNAVLVNKNRECNNSIIETRRLSGKYSDGYAWTGVSTKLKLSGNKVSFHVLSSKKKKNLLQFVKTLENKTKKKVVMGWNGGYILNNELVGKLNLSEEYVGTPLSFVVANSKINSLPLYNRPIFAINKKGKIIIDKLKLNFPGKVIWKQKVLFGWDASCINPKIVPQNKVAVYTPLSGLDKIPTNNRILVVVGGRKILKIIHYDSLGNQTPLFPAGCTFSLPISMKDQLNGLKENDEINFKLDLPSKWFNVTEALGAGPQLIDKGKILLNLKEEGWLLNHSIKTQAARRDRENERGPKIGCGLTKSGDLICVVVESRIRESVGATYREIAEILKKEGSEVAMGFDPGGSATLWAGEVVNIIPYTKSYNKNPLTGKPQVRPIANAVLVTK